MNRWILIILTAFLSQDVISQVVINVERQSAGVIQLTPDIDIPAIPRGYTVWLPEGIQPRGMIVFTHPRRDTVNSEFIIDYALENQLAVLYATTHNQLDFFFKQDRLREIENYLYEVILTCQIPKENLFFCGMSLEGTRALLMARYAKSSESTHQLAPRAIAICDSPLDMIRFHRAMIKAKNINFNPSAANEGSWVSAYLESNLGGTPENFRDSYLQYSPYSYDFEHPADRLQFMENIAIRAYTEPDVEWWMETRRKDFYSMNSIDLAALINELRIMGHHNAELILTSDKGYLPDRTRHPHSWSIVDEKELIDWFVSLMN